MSFYLTINTPKQVPYNEILSRLDVKNVESTYADDLHAPVSESGTKLFVRHKSTRGVTLSYSDQNYSIGLNVMASELDFELGFNTAKVISALTQAPILPEDAEEPIDADTLTKTYDKKWVDVMKLSGVNIFLDRIGTAGHVLGIGCCYMNYSVGPIVHSQLDTSSESNYYNSLVQHICKTQFWDREQYATSSVLQVTDRNTNEMQRMVVLYPTGSQFIPAVDRIILSAGQDRVDLPYTLLPHIITDKFHRVDENQYLVDPLTAAEYGALYDHAKKAMATYSQAPSQTSIAAGKASDVSNKKWWKFW